MTLGLELAVVIQHLAQIGVAYLLALPLALLNFFTLQFVSGLKERSERD